MKYLRFPALVATVALAALLSGCVVAPIGPRPVAMYPAQPVYLEPVPVVVVPAPRYHFGFHGYSGHRHWR